MRFTLAAFAVLVALPFVTSALTVDELRAQIEQLIGQINALQSQLGVPTVQQQTIVPQAAAVPAGTVQCPYISRSLKLGSEGDDVARLQRFLALDREIYPEAIVSGHYGPLTEAAVKRFQCKFKIVCAGSPAETGYGVTGPRTAAILALQCPDIAGNSGGFLRVSPVSGNVPLPVTVEVTLNTPKSCTASTYELDFGDNAQRLQLPVPANLCAEVRQAFTHTYVSGGTFVIMLRSGTQQTSATVHVSGPPGTNPSGDTLSASPTSGSAPLTVSFTGVANTAGICNSEPYSINFGDGQTSAINLSGCNPNSFTVSHAYSASGNFVARLYRGSTEMKSVSISVGTAAGESGGQFAVTPGFGGDVYTVEAEFELGKSCARYDLDWGDGSAHQSQGEGSCSSGTMTKRLSHTYGDTGTYTITLRRGANLSTTDSVGVSIVY